MKNQEPSTIKGNIIFYAYIVLLISVVFCFRAVTSITVGLLLFMGMVRTGKLADPKTTQKSLNLFLLGCILLFVLECVSSIYTRNISEQWTLLQRSSGIVLIPLAVLFSSQVLSTERFQKILNSFTLIISIGSVYCLLVTVVKFISSAPASIFFYHDLVKPLSQHAIQYSIMTFIALVWLIENPKQKNTFYPQWSSPLVVPFLSFFLLLLSSKLIIITYTIYLFYIFLQKRIPKATRRMVILAFVVSSSLLMITRNPVGDRFRAMTDGNSLLFAQQSFSPSIYFNGAQFRLLQWRFTSNVLSEQNAWIRGLTPGDAQSYLDKKYVDENMYTGVRGTDKRGFLGYHTHNQFLQSLLENGLLALAAFIFICYSLVLMAKERKDKTLNWLTALLIIYCFTDAPFKTQYGIVIFTLFPSLIFMAVKPKETQSTTASGNLPLLDPLSNLIKLIPFI